MLFCDLCCFYFFFSSGRRHTRCALVTGVQTCALPILFLYIGFRLAHPDWVLELGVATRLAAPAGFVGGVLQGAAGISAPISITFLNAMRIDRRSEEHTSELQSLMRISYAVFCLKKQQLI